MGIELVHRTVEFGPLSAFSERFIKVTCKHMSSSPRVRDMDATIAFCRANENLDRKWRKAKGRYDVTC